MGSSEGPVPPQNPNDQTELGQLYVKPEPHANLLSQLLENVALKDREEGETGYPLRPFARDCQFYIRTGSCKFGLDCKFNHPVTRNTQVFFLRFENFIWCCTWWWVRFDGFWRLVRREKLKKGFRRRSNARSFCLPHCLVFHLFYLVMFTCENFFWEVGCMFCLLVMSMVLESKVPRFLATCFSILCFWKEKESDFNRQNKRK